MPIVIHHLHYEFDDWLGDELLATSLWFIVTQRLGAALERASLTGFELRPVEITTSQQFVDWHDDLQLPEFKWLHITGVAGADDFGLSAGELIVSEQALARLRNATLNHCGVSNWS